MTGRILFEGVDLTTQEPQAVETLAAYVHKQISSDGVLDLGDVKLVRSSKGDCFYTVAATRCSCKGFTYRRTCKHIKVLGSSRLFSNLSVRFNLPEGASEFDRVS